MSCGMSKSGVGQRSKFLLLAHANVLGMIANGRRPVISTARTSIFSVVMLQISMALCAVHHRSNRNGPIGSMKQGYQLPGSYSFIEPMKALTVQALPVGRWIYEVKFDGYRALGFKNGKETRLV
jgi:ATP-dependent DNA ligase